VGMSRKQHIARSPSASRARSSGAPTSARANPKPGSPQVLMIRFWQEMRDGLNLEAVWRGEVSDLRGRRIGRFNVVGKLADLVVDAPEIIAVMRRDDGNQPPT